VSDSRRSVVVGAGLLGLATARAMAHRGWAVEVLEAASQPGHPRAGSQGGARIFRLGYPDRTYVEMAVLARALWRDLERDSGHELFFPTGQLSLGDEDTLGAIETAMEDSGATCARLTASAARTRFPLVATDGGALFEAESGVLAADECLRALRAGATFEVRTGVRVTAIHDDGDGAALVSTDAGAVRADVVVLCAGPGTLALLDPAPPVSRRAPASLPQVAYFGVPAGETVPVFIEWGADMIYGLPVPHRDARAGAAPSTLLKVSHHTPGPVLEQYDPTDSTPWPDDRSLVATLVAAVHRLLPALDPSPVATERCVYDNSADSDFVLDRIGRVVIGCGTSGHAFKFGPLLGELLADLADGSQPRLDLGLFGLGPAPRPAGPVSAER
jgi:sarcosine oxidase